MNNTFEMVAKTFQGLEDVLAEELRNIGAEKVEIGRRMVSFEGDLAMLYKANLCCRTALRILKPIYKFTAADTDALYDAVKQFDWSTVMSLDKTFAIDSVVNSDEFTHSQFVTYRVKDAIVDWFRDRYGKDKRPGVRLQDADVMLNVHIAGESVTLSLQVSLVAEDLGTPTPEVVELLLASGLPGMKVLQFAFDGREDNEHLPHGIPVNCVCYTGTHDNAPLGEWFAEESPECLDLARRFVGLNDEEGLIWGMVRQGMSSVAVLFFAQMQDYLELGSEARINTPGVLDGNWRWRLQEGQLTADLARRIAGVTRLYGRRATGESLYE